MRYGYEGKGQRLLSPEQSSSLLNQHCLNVYLENEFLHCVVCRPKEQQSALMFSVGPFSAILYYHTKPSWMENWQISMRPLDRSDFCLYQWWDDSIPAPSDSISLLSGLEHIAHSPGTGPPLFFLFFPLNTCNWFVSTC